MTGHMPIHWLSCPDCDLGQPCECAGAVVMGVDQSEDDASSDIAPEERCSLLEIKFSSRKSLLKRR